MSGETAPGKIGRGYARNLNVGSFRPMIGSFENRRDYAVISLFRDTGARLSELSGLGAEDVSAHDREAVVTGKGNKQRTVKYTYETARALDRYMRERAKHPMARASALWLGVRGGPMTSSGVYQVIERRASGGCLASPGHGAR
jgi:site-specific recombinase XerD